jgi:hypothetical protein
MEELTKEYKEAVERSQAMLYTIKQLELEGNEAKIKEIIVKLDDALMRTEADIEKLVHHKACLTISIRFAKDCIHSN